MRQTRDNGIRKCHQTSIAYMSATAQCVSSCELISRLSSDRTDVFKCAFCFVQGGHYIAYCRNELNQQWYEFDDQSVTEVSESCVQNAEAYVLFYK